MYIIVATYHNADIEVTASFDTLDEIEAYWNPKFEWDNGYEINYEEGDDVSVYFLAPDEVDNNSSLKLVSTTWYEDGKYFMKRMV